MRWFLDSDFKHWALMPDNFNELKHKAICSVCNTLMHPHYNGEPKEVGLSDRNKVEVILKGGLNLNEY